MNKFAFLAVFVLIFQGCTLLPGAKNFSGIKVVTDQPVSVYIDNQHIGQTTSDQVQAANFTLNNEQLKPGPHSVKLVMDSVNPPLTFEESINLLKGKELVIGRNYGTNPLESYGYQIEMEKIKSKRAELDIITSPENVMVSVDDVPKGLTPLPVMAIEPGNRKITVTATMYREVGLQVNPQVGYKIKLRLIMAKLVDIKNPSTVGQSNNSLTIESNLATKSATIAAVINKNNKPSPTPSSTPKPSPSARPSPTPTPKAPTPTPRPTPTPVPTPNNTELAKPYIEVLTTSTGWLRVRSEPNGLVDNELAKIYTGQKFPFVEKNDSGWVKIKYNDQGNEGWVAATYVKIYE